MESMGALGLYRDVFVVFFSSRGRKGFRPSQILGLSKRTLPPPPVYPHSTFDEIFQIPFRYLCKLEAIGTPERAFSPQHRATSK